MVLEMKNVIDIIDMSIVVVLVLLLMPMPISMSECDISIFAEGLV